MWTKSNQLSEIQITTTRPLRWGGEPTKIVKLIPLRYRVNKATK